MLYSLTRSKSLVQPTSKKLLTMCAAPLPSQQHYAEVPLISSFITSLQMRKLRHRDFPTAIQLSYEAAWKLPPESALLTTRPEVVGRIKCAAVNNDTVVLVNTSSFLQCLPPVLPHSASRPGGKSVSSQATAAFHRLGKFTLRLATPSLISDWAHVLFLTSDWLQDEQSLQGERGKCKRAAGFAQ